jgi:hypothetical protein
MTIDDVLVPPPHERRYKRHIETGDRWFLVTDKATGELMMRLDRGGGGRERTGQSDVPYDESNRHMWVDDEVPIEILPGQRGKIAFSADQQLCVVLKLFDKVHVGKHPDEAWRSLSHAKKRLWAERGPQAHRGRRLLWSAIMVAIEEYLRDEADPKRGEPERVGDAFGEGSPPEPGGGGGESEPGTSRPLEGDEA